MRLKSLRARQKPKTQPALLKTVIKLQQKYMQPLPISEAKKRDLMVLCKQRVIDKDYKWYKDLPVAAAVVDKVPLPNIGETSDTED